LLPATFRPKALSSEPTALQHSLIRSACRGITDHAQKIFEVGGRGSTLGIVLWGLGGLTDMSHRTMIAQFAEENVQQSTNAFQDVADRFAAFFWREYTSRLCRRESFHFVTS
jgi:hypothetical protein